jgi:hypothetical protein
MNCRISLAGLLLGSVAWLTIGHSAPAADPVATKDIVDTAVAADRSRPWPRLVRRELIDALKSKGPFTVLPTDKRLPTSVRHRRIAAEAENRRSSSRC